MLVPTVLLSLGQLTAAPAARCLIRNARPAVLRAARPDMAPLGGDRHVAGYVRVLVSLDAHGQVVGERIDRSVSSELDRPALEAAKRTLYQPAIRNCVGVPSTYLFSTFIDSM